MIEDEKIGELLRADAPPARDAMFRLGVIERRERQRFHRRSVILLAAAPLATLIIWFGFNSAGPVATVLVVALCAALAGACFLSIPGVLQVARRLRDLQRPSAKT